MFLCFWFLGAVTIAVEGLQNLTYARHSWPLSNEWGLFRVPPILWHVRGIRLKWSSPRIRDTHNYCRTFSSGAVTNCFNDLGLSQQGFEHPTFRLRKLLYYSLRQRRGVKYCLFSLYLAKILPIRCKTLSNKSTILVRTSVKNILFTCEICSLIFVKNFICISSWKLGATVNVWNIADTV